MTNYDYIKTLSKEQLAIVFEFLGTGNTATKKDWIEFFNKQYNAEDWRLINIKLI